MDPGQRRVLLRIDGRYMPEVVPLARNNGQIETSTTIPFGKLNIEGENTSTTAAPIPTMMTRSRDHTETDVSDSSISAASRLKALRLRSLSKSLTESTKETIDEVIGLALKKFRLYAHEGQKILSAVNMDGEPLSVDTINAHLIQYINKTNASLDNAIKQFQMLKKKVSRHQDVPKGTRTSLKRQGYA